MKLYYSPGACSLAPHILMEEIAAPYAAEKVDLAAKKTESGADFTTINNKGYVPTLEISKGEILTEAQVILQYLADKAGRTDLVPAAGTMERYHAQEMLNFVSSELHKGIGGLFNKAMPEDGRKAIIAKVSQRLDWLNALLGKQHYLNGAAFSAADAYAFTALGWSGNVGIDLSKWSNIAAYMTRVGQRPSVQAALTAEGLI